MKELDASLAARISDLEQVKNQLENQLSRLMQEQSNAEDAHRAELATLKAQLATEEHRGVALVDGLVARTHVSDAPADADVAPVLVAVWWPAPHARGELMTLHACA